MARNIDQVIMKFTIYTDEYQKAKQQILKDLLEMSEFCYTEDASIEPYPEDCFAVPVDKIKQYFQGGEE